MAGRITGVLSLGAARSRKGGRGRLCTPRSQGCLTRVSSAEQLDGKTPGCPGAHVGAVDGEEELHELQDVVAHEAPSYSGIDCSDRSPPDHRDQPVSVLSPLSQGG